MQVIRFSTAHMKINQIPCHFFKPQVSFPLNFASLSVSWHKIPLKFSIWIITPWTKKGHQSTNFESFVSFNESSPNSSCQFWNLKVKVYSNFASLFSVMKDNSSVFFSSNLYTLDKKQFSDFWMVGWKFIKFLMSCLKLQVSFSLIFASLFSVMRDNSSELF